MSEAPAVARVFGVRNGLFALAVLLIIAFPGKQYKLAQAWMALHTDELMADWSWPQLVLHSTKLIP